MTHSHPIFCFFGFFRCLFRLDSETEETKRIDKKIKLKRKTESLMKSHEDFAYVETIIGAIRDAIIAIDTNGIFVVTKVYIEQNEIKTKTEILSKWRGKSKLSIKETLFYWNKKDKLVAQKGLQLIAERKENRMKHVKNIEGKKAREEFEKIKKEIYKKMKEVKITEETESSLKEKKKELLDNLENLKWKDKFTKNFIKDKMNRYILQKKITNKIEKIQNINLKYYYERTTLTIEILEGNYSGKYAIWVQGDYSPEKYKSTWVSISNNEGCIRVCPSFKDREPGLNYTETIKELLQLDSL